MDASLGSGGGLVFVEAPGLQSSDLNAEVSPLEFWGNLGHLMTPTIKAPTDSAWQAPQNSEDTSPANVLETVTDDEAERGIVVNWQQTDYEYMLAVARQLEAVDNEGRQTAFSLRNPDGMFNDGVAEKIQGALDSGKSLADDQDESLKSYLSHVQAWLKYKHKLARWHRPSTASLKGARWLVPGFSTVIFGARVSWMGYIVGLDHTISADGSEDTQVHLDNVRPLTPVKTDLVTESKATATDTSRAAAQAQYEVENAHKADLRYLLDLVEKSERLDEKAAQNTGSAAAAYETESQTAAARVLARASTCAEACVGQTRTVAGALTAKTDPDLAQRLLSRLTTPPDPTPDEARKAYNDVARFYKLQESQVAAKQPAHGATEAAVLAINAAKITLAAAGSKLEALAAKLENDADFPTPPPFYNDDYIQLSSLDARHSKLLGCPAFYTGPYAAGISTGASTPYGSYLGMMQVLSRVFPALGSSLPDSSKVSASAQSWDDALKSGIGTRRWSAAFSRRSAMTLRQYLQTHGFHGTLQEVVSDEPAPTVFYVMQPVATGASRLAAAGKTYTWDNSVVCRLVDERTRSGESSEVDPLMAQRRARARSIFLTSGARQDLIVSYSRKHFGSRGFSGE
jgi:hypothetical protein